MTTANTGLGTESMEAFSILEHLNELRIRLTWAAGGIVVATILALAFTVDLLQFILQPYENSELVVLGPTEGIETFFRVAITAGLIISMPWLLFQVWKFVEPALTKEEKKYIYLFLPTTVILFSIGILFAWFVLVPTAINFLSTFLTQSPQELTLDAEIQSNQELIDFMGSEGLTSGLILAAELDQYLQSKDLGLAKTFATALEDVLSAAEYVEQAAVAQSIVLSIEQKAGQATTDDANIFRTEWTSDAYISFVLKMVFWLGVSFEMPVIFYFIGRFGFMEHRTLAQQWRFAIVGVSVLAAIITPSIDPITMLITMLPLLVLYFMSIGTTFIGYRQHQRKLGLESES
ncbi:MAG: twin-arginine translocase subunit TatC [Chloroflexota bacterium]